MAKPIGTIIRGRSFKGIAHLKTTDQNGNNAQPYVFQIGDVVEMHFPADTNAPNLGAPVFLSTANAGELTLNSPAPGDVTFNLGPTKAGKTLVSNPAGAGQSIDIYVTHTNGDIDAFEKQTLIAIKDPDNA